MASLIDTNPYLRDPEERARMLEENARQSSVFEGARGLPGTARRRPAAVQPGTDPSPARPHTSARERRETASAK